MIKLSPRQQQILELFSYGNSEKAIANKLNISVRTVNVHASSIRNRLQVARMTYAVRKGFELGYLK